MTPPYEAGGLAAAVGDCAFSVTGAPELASAFIVCGVMVTVDPDEACMGPDGVDFGSLGGGAAAAASDCTGASALASGTLSAFVMDDAAAPGSD